MGVNRPRDEPWLIRTYAGHTSAAASNALYKANLAAGQTGLSVAFDLPTQCGYDPDDAMARGEVGRVGVPVASLGDMRALFSEIPLADMNTSMTINATAAWLLALYVTVADEQGAARATLQGTTQNDILKEYLSRGTYVFPPAPSMRIITDMSAFCAREMPAWNPMNVCSYHLQEAGAEPHQEIAYTLANAIAVLDAARPVVPADDFPRIVGRISFFCNAGIRFVEEACKMRAFTALWDEITLSRYGVTDPRYRRFRYGVQVNSLGLTALQPENNVYRIMLEALGVTLGRDARARALQLPAWNEALGLPRQWDQQWSLRLQQILALESDLLEYDDIFAGSHVIEAKTTEVTEAARAELQKVLDLGGSVAALDYMKTELVAAHARRRRSVEDGATTVVGVNAFTEGVSSPLDGAGLTQSVDEASSANAIDAVRAWRASRDEAGARAALDGVKRAASGDDNLMEASLIAARAGVTTGEWASALRDVFGEFRAPTGVDAQPYVNGVVSGPLDAVRARVDAVALAIGVKRLRILVGKPGLDGHSNGAEQVALRARDAGFEVIYDGIRLSAAAIAQAAADEDVHLVGLSILSGAHTSLVPDVLAEMRARGVDPAIVPVVVGGIIPAADEDALRAAGVAGVYTPADFDLTQIVGEMASAVARAHGVDV